MEKSDSTWKLFVCSQNCFLLFAALLFFTHIVEGLVSCDCEDKASIIFPL
jgi:hypothetical protein